MSSIDKHSSHHGSKHCSSQDTGLRIHEPHVDVSSRYSVPFRVLAVPMFEMRVQDSFRLRYFDTSTLRKLCYKVSSSNINLSPFESETALAANACSPLNGSSRSEVTCPSPVRITHSLSYQRFVSPVRIHERSAVRLLECSISGVLPTDTDS